MLLRLCIAMLAFAANSVLCRLALVNTSIDPVSFSVVRVTSGAVTLLFLFLLSKERVPLKWNIKQAFFLAVYVLAFSLAYIHIEAGTGALLLFGIVQLSMVLYGVFHGEKLNFKRFLGLILALAGIVILLLPNSKAPPFNSALLMIISGIAWACYSISGKQITNPLASTFTNFVLAVPIVIVMGLFFIENINLDIHGVMFAMLSGGLASSGAYVLWYAIVRKIDSITASTVQLSVPCLAILGGSLFVGESISLRMIVSTLIVLAGIFLVINATPKKAQPIKI